MHDTIPGIDHDTNSSSDYEMEEDEEDLDWIIPIEKLTIFSSRHHIHSETDDDDSDKSHDSPDISSNSSLSEDDLYDSQVQVLNDSLTLKSYQKEAITWLRYCEDNPLHGCRGGILSLNMGLGKCNHPDTPILLWNGDIKKAKDIQVGDLLIGDNNTPRTVLSVCQGKDQMYKIIQNKGNDYIVNEPHILSLKFSGHKGYMWLEKYQYYTLMWLEKIQGTAIRKTKIFSVRPTAEIYRTKDEAHKKMLEFRDTIDVIEYTQNTRRHRQFVWLKKTNTYQLIYYENTQKRTKNFRVDTECNIYRTKDEALVALLKFRDNISNDDVLDISVKEFLSLPTNLRAQFKGYKCGVNFPFQKVRLDPYILGAWLGDGHSNGKRFTNIDEECLQKFKTEMEQIDCKFTQLTINGEKTISYSIAKSQKGRETNKFEKILYEYDLINNKHIPREYLINDRETRLQVLAGLLDTDGHYAEGGYEIVQKNKMLADHILYLVRSLGFYARRTTVQKTCTNGTNGPVTGTYYLCYFSGEGVEEIPCLVKRKQAPPRVQKKDVLVTNITIEPLGMGEYCGFTLDGNHRYLLGDFTVTHNTIVTLAHCMMDWNNNREPPEFPTLVVCSMTVMYTWKTEIEKFFGNSCKYLVFHKNEMKKSTYDNLTVDDLLPYRLILTTYDTIMNTAKRFNLAKSQYEADSMGRNLYINHAKRPSLSRMKKASGPLLLFRIPFHRIIADEIHNIVNPKSARFYSMMCLYGERKIGISGTPLKNYSSDMYSNFRFLGYDQVSYPKQFSVATYHRDHLDTRVLFRNSADVGEIFPDITHHQVFLTLDGHEKEIYDYYYHATKKVYKGFREGRYNYSNVLVLFLRLRQICVSAYTVLAESSRNHVAKITDEDASVSQKVLQKLNPTLNMWLKNKNGTSGILSSKIQATIKIINEVPPGEKILIFTSFKKVIDIIALALKTHSPHKKYLTLDGDITGEDRTSTLNEFKHPNSLYDIMLISYKVGSEGLTLIEANHIIHMENWWSPVVQEQAESRVCRIGQTKKVNIWKLLVKDSIEERIEKICDDKRLLRHDFLIAKKKDSRPDSQAMASILNLQF